MSNAVTRAVRGALADQRIRYLMVGAFNTLLGISTFALFELTISHYLGRFGYMVSLILSYIIGICVAFVLHRRLVFKVKGNTWVDFGRFVLTNGVGFLLNAVILPLLIETAHLPSIVAQGISALLVAMATYFLHKHFSFRRKVEAAPMVSTGSTAGKAETH